MKLYHIKSILFFIVLSSGLVACIKEPKYSNVPAIEFFLIDKNIRLDQFSGAKKDSINIILQCQDGNGDMGVNASDIGTTVGKTDYNYVVKPFRKSKGVFVEFTPLETLSGFYPVLYSDTKPAPIQVRLRHLIEIQTAFWPVKKDTVKFQIYIKDRAGNKSNTVDTTPIIINEF